ncbi:MAG TPA: DUF3786 domain-containing protein [Desulfobacterales bacterium]|nr:DUF3786 domain-containing protein [Desulfobacterales bacterium]
MTNSIDESYFIELAEKNPEDVCRLALCDYDPEKKGYQISVWGEDYGIYPNESKIVRLQDDNPDVGHLLKLFIIYYLLRSKDIPISKEWISEKDIPGGATFFRGPHKIPTHIIEARYEDNIEEFREICERLDGVPLDMADAAYAFEITPRIPVAVQFWDKDDEFSAEAKILFDKTITEQLAPDIIFCLTVEICRRIGDG